MRFSAMNELSSFFGTFCHGIVFASSEEGSSSRINAQSCTNGARILVMPATDKTLDITGVTGPRTATITEQTLNGMGPGQVLKVICRDRQAKHGIQELCARMNCTLEIVQEESSLLVLTIEKAAV